MNEYKKYFVRPMRMLKPASLDEYADKIVTPGMDKDSRQLQRLFSDSFSHHRFPYSSAPDDELVILKNDPNSLIALDNLSSCFTEKHYVEHLIYATASLDRREQDRSTIGINEFIELVTANPITSSDLQNYELGSNRVSYLIGNVGQGKTAMIMKMIKMVLSDVPDDTGYFVAPIYIDFDNYIKPNGELAEIDDDFFRDLFKETIRIIGSMQFSESAQLDLLALNPGNDPLYCLKALSHHLAKRKIRLLYILDNMDRYHFFWSRYSFFKQYSDEQHNSVSRNLHGLIKTFNNQSELGFCGFCVIMVCRRYVYQYLRNVVNDPAIPSEDQASVFQLQNPSETEVVNSRMALFQEAVNAIEKANPSKVKDWKEVISDIEAGMKVRKITKEYNNTQLFKQPALESIRNLSHHGYRSFMRFLSSLQLNYKEYDVIERLFSKQPITLIVLYINNLMKRYTQEGDHFPNMFLNDCVVQFKKRFKIAHEPHMHTYWLKYFVLKFLVHRTNPPAEDICELFHEIGGYKKHLVLHVLGSLCTSNEFHCADIDYSFRNTNLLSRQVTPTDRGIYIVNFDTKLYPKHTHQVDFCFSFIYLQLIIDDYLLAFPKPWIDKVLVDKNYSYLYKNNRDYGQQAVDIIKDKAYAIMYFVRILKAALQIEKEIRPRLFEELEDMDLVPEMTNITSSIKEEVKHLFSTMGIAGQYDHFTKTCEEMDTDKSFEEFFGNYYKSGVEVA